MNPPDLADGENDTPWTAPDGTRWLHFHVFGEWNGWMPQEPGLWFLTEDEFEASYGEAWRAWRAEQLIRRASG